MTAVPKSRLTPAEYLTIERQAAFKSEFFAGEMFAMAGASREHQLLWATGRTGRHGSGRVLNWLVKRSPGGLAQVAQSVIAAPDQPAGHRQSRVFAA